MGRQAANQDLGGAQGRRRDLGAVVDPQLCLFRRLRRRHFSECAPRRQRQRWRQGLPPSQQQQSPGHTGDSEMDRRYYQGD